MSAPVSSSSSSSGDLNAYIEKEYNNLPKTSQQKIDKFVQKHFSNDRNVAKAIVLKTREKSSQFGEYIEDSDNDEKVYQVIEKKVNRFKEKQKEASEGVIELLVIIADQVIKDLAEIAIEKIGNKKNESECLIS